MNYLVVLGWCAKYLMQTKKCLDHNRLGNIALDPDFGDFSLARVRQIRGANNRTNSSAMPIRRLVADVWSLPMFERHSNISADVIMPMIECLIHVTGSNIRWPNRQYCSVWTCQYLNVPKFKHCLPMFEYRQPKVFKAILFQFAERQQIGTNIHSHKLVLSGSADQVN